MGRFFGHKVVSSKPFYPTVFSDVWIYYRPNPQEAVSFGDPMTHSEVMWKTRDVVTTPINTMSLPET